MQTVAPPRSRRLTSALTRPMVLSLAPEVKLDALLPQLAG